MLYNITKSTYNNQQQQAVMTSTVWVTLLHKKVDIKNCKICIEKTFTHPLFGPLGTNHGQMPPTANQNAVRTIIGIALAPILF